MWLQSRGDRVFLRRFKTPFAEIDILAMNAAGQILVFEVKTSFWPDDRALGLGFRQRARLARAAFWIASETGRDVEVSLLGLIQDNKSTQRGQFCEVPIF